MTETQSPTNPEQSSSRARKAQPGKYLTFEVAQEHYGLEIKKVVEIIGVMPFTRVPRCPAHMRGVINLRGKIIPIIDLRLKFSIPEIPYDDKTCVIITKVQAGGSELAIGMIVDTVLEVVTFDSSQIENTPDYGVNLDSKFITGLGKIDSGRVTILIDVAEVLSEHERTAIAEISTTPSK